MFENLRKVAAVAGLAAMTMATSAYAAEAAATLSSGVVVAPSYTYNFKTFYDTSTVLNPFDTKTWGSIVATLKVEDLQGGGGVKLTLTELNTDFPAKNGTGTLVDNLWLNGNWGTVASSSGVGASGGSSFLPIVKDGGYIYNGNVNFAGTGITEGNTSIFTIKGSNVSAYNFAKSSNIPMLELSNVGGIYNTFLSGGKVNFIGTVQAVPEPGTYLLMGLGLVGVVVASRRARRNA
jgi:hypothetical protein